MITDKYVRVFFVDYGFPVYVFAYKSMNRLSS